MKLKEFADKNIKNIFFDFGNVVLNIDIPLSIRTFKSLGIKDIDNGDTHPYLHDFFIDLEVGNITNEQFLACFREKFTEAADIDDSCLWDAWNSMLLDYDPARIEFIKEVSKHYNIYLLSNTNEPHRACFDKRFRDMFGYELESLFKICFYSDQMHMRKPNVEIFERAIKESGVEPSQTLFIDDTEGNFAGAAAAGLHCYHLTDGKTIIDLFEK